MQKLFTIFFLLVSGILIAQPCLEPGKISHRWDMLESVPVCEGSDTYFGGIEAKGGSAAVSYQWQSSSDGTLFTDLVGITSNDLQSFTPDKNVYIRRIAFAGQRTCDTAFSNVLFIQLEKRPSDAVAGPDQVICGESTSMYAIYPVTGEGQWSAQDVIVTPGRSPNGIASVFPIGTTRMVWWVSNGAGSVCLDNSDTVNITRIEPTTISEIVTQYDTVCLGSNVSLAGSNPKNNEKAEWSIAPAAWWEIQETTGNKTAITFHEEGVYTVTYTLVDTTNICTPSASRKEITVLPKLHITQNGLVLSVDNLFRKQVEWYKNGVSVSNSDTSILALTDGTYKVLAPREGCSDTSSIIFKGISDNGQGLLSAPMISGATYSWYLDSQIITSATSYQYQANSTGIYSVEIQFSGNDAHFNQRLEDNLTATYTYNLTQLATGFENEQYRQNIMFSVSPNPNEGMFYLNGSETGDLEVCDTKGQLLKRQKIQGVNQQIDISDLKAGTYLCRFTTNDGVKFGKVVKQ